MVRYNAVFFLLNKLEPGDSVNLVYNHKLYSYLVTDKKVVGAGKVIAEVEKIAERKTGRKSFPTVFAERGIHVY